jgi:hypothetical protein
VIEKTLPYYMKEIGGWGLWRGLGGVCSMSGYEIFRVILLIVAFAWVIWNSQEAK